MSTTHKEPVLIIAASLITMIASIIFSKGYYPEPGLLWSLINEMKLYDGYIICNEYSQAKSSDPAWMKSLGESCLDGFNLALMTKYIIFPCLLTLTYGILMLLNITPRIFSKENL